MLDMIVTAFEPRCHPADADIEKAILFRHIPGIARQTLPEKPEMAARIFPWIFELQFLRHDLQFILARMMLAKEVAIDGTTRTTGTDEISASVPAVDGKAISIALDRPDRMGFHRRATALEQPGIELVTPDGVLCCPE